MQEVKIIFNYYKNTFLLTIKKDNKEKIIQDKIENFNKIILSEGI